MRPFHCWLGVAAISLAVAGCNNNKETTSTTPQARQASASADATSMSSATQAQAQKLLDQTMQYTRENKLDLAESSLQQLEGMKGQLPASFQPKIDNARKALDAAKAVSGSKMPGM